MPKLSNCESNWLTLPGKTQCQSTGHRPVENNSKRKTFNTAWNRIYPDPCRSWQARQTFLHVACWQNSMEVSSLTQILASTPRTWRPQAGSSDCPCHRGRQSSRYRPTRIASISLGPGSTLEVWGQGSTTSSSEDEFEELSELSADDSTEPEKPSPLMR